MFLKRVGNEPGLSRKNFPDGAYKGIDPLDAVNALKLFIRENDIRIFAHQLDDEVFLAQIPHFIQVLKFEAYDTFEVGLFNLQDSCTAQVLS